MYKVVFAMALLCLCLTGFCLMMFLELKEKSEKLIYEHKKRKEAEKRAFTYEKTSNANMLENLQLRTKIDRYEKQIKTNEEILKAAK